MIDKTQQRFQLTCSGGVCVASSFTCTHNKLQACEAAVGHPSAWPYTTKVMITGSPFSKLELHFLDVAHPQFKSLADQFTSKWLHAKPKKGVKVVDVIKIEVCRCSSKRHVGIAGVREGRAPVDSGGS